MEKGVFLRITITDSAELTEHTPGIMYVRCSDETVGTTEALTALCWLQSPAKSTSQDLAAVLFYPSSLKPFAVHEDLHRKQRLETLGCFHTEL